MKQFLDAVSCTCSPRHSSLIAVGTGLPALISFLFWGEEGKWGVGWGTEEEEEKVKGKEKEEGERREFGTSRVYSIIPGPAASLFLPLSPSSSAYTLL